MLRFLNPANLATLLRLALTPVIALEILGGHHTVALALFVFAGLTDVIDGALARHCGWSSTAGAYLDPICDKVLLSTIYICLALRTAMPWWFVGVIFGRDILILLSAGAALVLTDLRKFPPSVWGKFSTFLQLVTATAWMIRNAEPSFTLDSIARALIWPATAATVWSGVHYGWRGIRLVRTD